MTSSYLKTGRFVQNVLDWDKWSPDSLAYQPNYEYVEGGTTYPYEVNGVKHVRTGHQIVARSITPLTRSILALKFQKILENARRGEGNGEVSNLLQECNKVRLLNLETGNAGNSHVDLSLAERNPTREVLDEVLLPGDKILHHEITLNAHNSLAISAKMNEYINDGYLPILEIDLPAVRRLVMYYSSGSGLDLTGNGGILVPTTVMVQSLAEAFVIETKAVDDITIEKLDFELLNSDYV
jgi:hypothetical protein